MNEILAHTQNAPSLSDSPAIRTWSHVVEISSRGELVLIPVRRVLQAITFYKKYEANARLIAAAPELLAALKEAVSNLDDWAASEDEREYDVTPEGLRSLSRQLTKAIASAEGL